MKERGGMSLSSTSRALACASIIVAVLGLCASMTQGGVRGGRGSTGWGRGVELEGKTYLSAMGELPIKAMPMRSHSVAPAKKSAVPANKDEGVEESFDTALGEHSHMDTIRMSDDVGGEDVDELIEKEEKRKEDAEAAAIRKMTAASAQIESTKAPAIHLAKDDAAALNEPLVAAAQWSDHNIMSTRLPQDRPKPVAPAQAVDDTATGSAVSTKVTTSASAPTVPAMASTAMPATVLPAKVSTKLSDDVHHHGTTASPMTSEESSKHTMTSYTIPPKHRSYAPRPSEVAKAAAMQQLATSGHKDTNGWAQPGGWQAANKASALRTRSFWSALHDCREKGTCKELLGTKLWDVLRTKAGQLNIHIFHDQDPERKEQERKMEKDFLSARPVDDKQGHSSATREGDVSSRNWQKLEAMMDHERPAPERHERITRYLTPWARKDLIHAKAEGMSRVYARESDMIYGDDNAKPVHSRSMRKYEAAEHSESSKGTKMQLLEGKALRGLSSELRGDAGQGVQEVLKGLHIAAKKLRTGGDGVAAEKALEQGIKAHEDEDMREDKKVQMEADQELKGFDRPYGGDAQSPTQRVVARRDAPQPMAKAVAVKQAKLKTAVARPLLQGDALAEEEACWKTGRGCGKLMKGLSGRAPPAEAEAVRVPAAARGDRGGKKVVTEEPAGGGNTDRHGLKSLSERLGGVLGF